ncbi:MAG: hypothetical protein LLF98_08615 [Clostridium sp.]|uniref:hypothetical protein n=1 Tax=Clostridium sp. TaxID=1506 RepID=UPI0025BB953B|nr:hypothetical protein [Clostridium sp.]MCE5221311.1 hypothetical protein [Clostridium sp.]
MKKFIFAFLFFSCLSFNINIIPSIASTQAVKQGIYTITDLNLSPNTKYIVQNNSFNERIYLIVFDSKPNVIQAIRLRPQSKTYNLKPLQSDYTIVVVGDGELTIY